MHKEKFRNKNSSEAGVALIFALAILALLLIMLIGFLASSLLEQRIAYTYGDAAASRLMARGVLVRIQNQLARPSDAIIWMRNRPDDAKLLAPIVSIADDGDLKQATNDKAEDNGEAGDAYQALKPLLRRSMGGDYSDLTESEIKKDWHWRNFFPNGVKVDYPQWIYYYNNPDKDIITGRAAYVIIPNFGIDPTLLGNGANARLGAEYPELSLQVFANTTGVDKMQKYDNWLSLDWLIGKAGMTANTNFDFSEVNNDFYAGKLGAKDSKTDDSASDEAYREFASLYFTSNQVISPEKSDMEDHNRHLFDFGNLQSFTDYKTLLDNVKLEPSTVRNQVAANLRDYMDSDDTPTSDITPSEWSATNVPSYTGNEKTPYINQIIPAVQLSVTHQEFKAMYAGKPYRDLTQRLTLAATLKFYLEAINIYRESLETKNIYIGGYEIKLQLTAHREHDNHTMQREIVIAGNGTASIGEVSANGYSVNNGTVHSTGDCPVMTFPLLKQLDNAIPTPPIDLKVEVTGIKFDYLLLRDKDGNNVDYVKGINNTTSYVIAGTSSTLDPSTNLPVESKHNVITLKSDKQQEVRSGYFSFAVRDPRCNLDNSEWDFELARSSGELSTAAIPNFGSANSNADAKNADPTKEKDMEPESDPAKLTSAYIRNGAMESPWELGFIHRGQAWQTLNLKSTLDPLTAAGEKVTYRNDGLLWDLLKFTSGNSADKFNINYPASRNSVFMPLLRNLKYHQLTPAINTHELKESSNTETLSGDAEKSLRNWIANKCYKSASGDPADNSSDVYNRYIHRGQLGNVITDWALNSSDSPFKGKAFGDIHLEELIGKIVPLTRCGENFEYFTVFAVAQSIKDIKGTAYTFKDNGEIDQTKSGLAHGGKAESEADGGVTAQQYDKITNTTYLVARLRRVLSSCENKDTCLHGIHSSGCTFSTQVIECYTLSEP